jgi:hypothetical protein
VGRREVKNLSSVEEGGRRRMLLLRLSGCVERED